MTTTTRGFPTNFPNRILEGILSLLLTAILLLILLQVVLRSAFSGGITWVDPLVRHLVVWTGFLGAVLAAGKGRHITIDLLSHALPPGIMLHTGRLNNLFASAVCGLLTHGAYSFVRDEMAAGGASRSIAGIPATVFILVYPAALGLLSLCFLLRACAARTSAGASAGGPSKSLKQ